MRVGLVSVGLVGLLALGCNENRAAPSGLMLSPEGSVTVLGPKSFQAVATNTGASVTWSLSGNGARGSLSASSGERVVYRPPAMPTVGETETLTATSGTFTATAQLHLSPPALAGAKIPGLTAPVEVRYDAWEVPHIRCAQAVDCFAAQGYLQARDRLFQMDFLRRVAVGRLAELVGVLGLEQDVQLRTLFTTRAGERLGDALARNMEDVAPTFTKTRVKAYINGINARLAELRAAGGALGGEYAQLPYPVTAADVPDWTISDMMSFVRLQQYSLSSTLDEEVANGRFVTAYPPNTPANAGKLDVWIRTAQPSTEQTFTLQPTRAPVALALLPARTIGTTGAARAAAPNLSGWGGPLRSLAATMAGVRAALKPLDGSTGSNNWVIDAAHSATGKAMVANDPHLSLQYPPNFHLSALTSANPADHLDVTGGSFPGTPGAQVGRGQHVGWGVTVVGYDVTDIYQEQFLPPSSCGGFPYCVLFNAGPVNLIPVPIAFKVRTPAGLVDATALGLPSSKTPPAAVLVVPHHGPIIQAPDGTGKAFSVRWTGHEDATQDISGFLGLNIAQNVGEAVTALNGYATGAQNFVLADDAGQIAYYPHALVPKRPWAGTAPAGQPLLPWYPLPGDGSAEWGTGVAGDACAASGSAEPKPACWIANSDLPQGGTAVSPTPAAGFFITANADPIGASNNTLNAFGVPFDLHGNYLSYSWDDSTAFRHARITQRIQALTASGGKVSEADMESIQTDHVSRLGSAFEHYIEAMPAGSPSFEAARTVLAGWKVGGYDCPSGLTGIDPKLSPVDTSAVVQGNSAGCYLFHQFVRELLPAVFADDLAVAGLGVSGGNAVKGMLHMLENPTTVDQGFCQNVDADGNKVGNTTCQQQVAKALEAAYASLAGRLGPPSAWVWGRVHTFQPVSQFSPVVSLGYSPGPFARPGGAFTVDVASPSLSAAGTSFAYGSSANVRHVSVMDPATPRVRMQLPGPEVSRPYGVTVGPDLLTAWARNVYFDYAHGDQVLGATVATQSITTP